MKDSSTEIKSLCVWDDDAEPNESTSELTYCWTGYRKSDSVRSVSHYVEDNADQLRARYLAFIHELGESKIYDKRLIDHLALEKGLSFWWISLFVEKSLYKSPITDVIRILAVEEVINQHKPTQIKLVSSNRILHDVISDLCFHLGITYEWKQLTNTSNQHFNLKSILPRKVLALISLARNVFFRWPLKQVEKSAWSGNESSIFFCSQFSNINRISYSSGKFTSDLWKGLPELLQAREIKLNWLQLFVPHDDVPKPKIAMDYLQRFNQNGQDKEFHTFLDAHLSWRIILRVLKKWLWLNFVTWHLRNIKTKFRPSGSQLFLWPLMKVDWQSSMYGQVAINNLLWLELFDETMDRLPHQKIGLYLCENQAWERALVHTWHKHGHGQLIAVAHSTVRYWDLRHYSDPRTITASDANPIPQADLMALNGKAAVDAYLSMGFPKQSIVELEALRYDYLNKLKIKDLTKTNQGEAIKILILGDYMSSATIKMLELLEEAAPNISTPIEYTMKPHPNFVVKAEDYPSLNLKVVMDPLGEILHDYDIAYSSNMTSAAVDAHLAGLPSVVILDEMGLNFSPLRGQSSVYFVSTPSELANTLQVAHTNKVDMANCKDFFFLDPELPRWQRLLLSDIS